jgi:hypothetical protein
LRGFQKKKEARILIKRNKTSEFVEGMFCNSITCLNWRDARIDCDGEISGRGTHQVGRTVSAAQNMSPGLILRAYQCAFRSDRLTSAKMFLIGTDIFIIEMVIDFNYV